MTRAGPFVTTPATTQSEAARHARSVSAGVPGRTTGTADGLIDGLLAVLAGTAEPDLALRLGAQSLVPTLADGCILDAVDDAGTTRAIASAHVDPALARVLADGLAVTAGAESRAEVVAAARGRRARVLTGEVGATGAPLHPDLGEGCAFDAATVLCVPLPHAGRVAGVLTAWRAGGGRAYGRDELALAERVAPLLGALVRGHERAGADQRARNELLSVVAHEVGTPLGTMQLHVDGALRRCRREAPNPVPPEWLATRLEAAQQQSRRLARLLEAVLQACHAESGALAVRREAVDLAAVVRDAVERQREDLAWARCALSVELPERADGRWDPVRVEQVVTNLLSNAMKYGAGRPVSLRLEVDESGARILVTDAGPGMSEEQQARIFARFERGADAGPARGFGLGLWVVRTIAEAHGGSVSVASRLGAGSTFAVSLPSG